MADPDTRPERRKDPRFTARVPIYLAIGGEVVRKTVHLESRDVSAGGLSFETGREIPLDAEAQVVLAHAGEEKGAVAIHGRVVWTRLLPETGRYVVGVRFTDLDGLTPDSLRDLIERRTGG
jgi:c-di-GMP-binding flagellar brake protein YcgR